MVKADRSHTFTHSHVSMALFLINHMEKFTNLTECSTFSGGKNKFSLNKHVILNDETSLTAVGDKTTNYTY
jgi:hypothetical protein